MSQLLAKSTFECEVSGGCRASLRYLLHHFSALALGAAAALLALTLQTAPVQAQDSDRPNIIYIMTDDK